MHSPVPLLLALFSLCLALAHPRAEAAVKAALMPWECVPARTDVQRVANELVALAQAELSAEPDIEWVERAELDKLVAEADLAVAGRLDPRASLRVGKLAGAQLLVTGRLDAADHSATTLELEAVDLDRGDLLASRPAPIPPRPHKHHALREEDRAAVVATLKALLAEAGARRRELEAKPAVALLFLANTGPSSRLDEAGRRLEDALRASALEAGARMLRFPRVRDAESEQDLAILGLAEADERAWRGVADLYVWGEYKEIPAVGEAFEDTPVEASLTLWDGSGPPRSIPWRGKVSTFPSAAGTFAAAIAPAIRRAERPADTARAEAAKLLVARADEAARPHQASLAVPDFWRSELGLNFAAHRVRLLETAAFLAPENAAIARRLYEARHVSPLPAPDAAALWRRYLDRSRLDARFPADPEARPRRTGRIVGPDRIALLEQVFRRLAEEMSRDPAGVHARATEVARRWTDEVLREKNAGRATAAFSTDRLRFLIGDGGVFYQTRHDVGTDILRRMIEDAWPVLAPAYAARSKENPDSAESMAFAMIQVFGPVAREDFAYHLCLSALETAPPQPAAKPRRAEPRQTQPERPPGPPAWGAPRAETGSTLPGSPRALAWWHEAASTPEEWLRRAQLSAFPFLKPTDRVRLLGFDGHRLWLDRPPLPDSDPTERAAFSLAAFAPWSRSLESAGSPPGATSRAVALAAGPDALYVATEFDGLWRLGPERGVWRRYTLEEGLPSLKIADLAWSDAGLLVASAAPENLLALLDPATDRWISLQGAQNATPPPPASRPRAPGDGENNLRPRVAASGRWALLVQGPPRLRDLRDPSRRDPLEIRRERTEAAKRENLRRIMQEARDGATSRPVFLPRDWSLDAPAAVLADGAVFWLAGDFGLVRLDPEREAEANWEKCPPILALADAGTHLWALFGPDTDDDRRARPRPSSHDGDGPAPRTRVGCYDKTRALWVGHYWIEDEITALAYAPGTLWAAGRDLHEFDVRAVVPDWRATISSKPDPAVGAVGLADQTPFETIARDNIAGARALLATGSSLPTGRSGITLLHVAARLAGPDMVGLLLAGGASPQVFDADGLSPLALAAERGDVAMVEKLLAAGTPADIQARPHNSPRMLDLARPRPPAPIQPTNGRVELLPDGRARLHWTAPPDSAESYSLYRADDPPAGSPQSFRGQRNGRMDSRWLDVGDVVAGNIPGDARAWIDDRPRPPGATSTYVLIAETGKDRYGPPSPATLATLRNPAGPFPPARLGERPPELRDPTALQLAALAGHAGIVSRLLAAGASPSTPDANGRGALHYAIVGEHHEIARALLEAGADLDLQAGPARSNNGRAGKRVSLETGGTALVQVYEARRDLALFKSLLAAGANPGGLAATAALNGREDDLALLTAAEKTPYQSAYYGRPPFLAALQAGRVGLALRLRESGFAPRDPRWPDEARHHLAENAMTTAIARKDVEWLAWLIDRGADPTNYDYKNPLLLAIQSGDAEIARLLIRHGAKPGRLDRDLVAAIDDPAMRAALGEQTRSESLRFPWSNSSSPAQFGRPAASRYGFAKPPPRNPAAEQALRLAAARGDAATMLSSLREGAYIDATDEKGWSALIHAISEKHLDAARVLIDAGARLDLVTRYGSTALVFATTAGDRAFVEELLDLGADPNLVAERSSTPLHIALMQNPDLARPLLARGAHPELIFHLGGFARDAPVLFHLARQGRLDAIRLIVEHGADPRRMVWRGKWTEAPVPGLTALPFAAASDDLPTLEYFLGLGLDPAWENAYGDNALDWALDSKADRTAARLRELGLKTRVERGLPAHEH